MYLGNSRMLLGKSTNDVVYGEWKAVAPNGATGGYYGAVGSIASTVVNVFAMEWSELTGTLIFGGQFPNIVNGDPTLQQARSIAYFNGTDYKILPQQTGITGVGYGSGGLGYVYDIREIKHSTNHYHFLIVGNFDRDGLSSVPPFPGETISIAQYSTEEEKWIPFGSGAFVGRVSGSDYAYRISNLISDSSGITAYVTGTFNSIKYNSDISQDSEGAFCYRYNTPAPVGGHTSQLIACDFELDPAIYGGVAWLGAHIRNGSNGDDKLYLIGDGSKMVVFSNPQSPSTISHHQTINLPTIQGRPRPRVTDNFTETPGFGMFSFSERSTNNENYLYAGYTPIQQSVLTNTSTSITFNSIDTQFNGCDTGTVFYNSGNHLVAVLDGLNGPKQILFYNTETNKFKNIPIPNFTTPATPRISCVEIDDSGNIYIGGLFQFQDSDGNTACSVAKFVPDASKLP
jgi:hypothetical protein